ncbi:NAD(P)/FAD-dependent oxidoreductase [Campylobacter coli]|uniref:FAD-dependent oxidoreductase n=1 Tax=Campylobacter coli TaxID=195 RepID=UPI0012894FB3|nr:NAD(P)/FAD-dependent oxidoreductase [Campylobacter coli]ECO5522037.1 NAD(P)/FAD-dependent oxidoreductase [Campylobacter coli]EDB1184276.1 NAD(P)/FAD-dependent oxidoreductase [Campylobacter coli]EFK9891200.1 NAD(P)/FAD-dependent oxidoreductase [Campylobacter coli]EIY4183199.1 NAD(P)/FAD-dependent oxidoreductase [Campylobacter coli]
MKKSIAIIGGSVAGLSAALFFASAKNDELDFDITIFDDDKADLKAAAIYNVPFFPKGAKADEIYTHIKAQIASMLEVKYIDSKVVSISGEKGDFTVNDEQGLGIKADYIIVATGASKSEIKGLEDFVIPHELMPKPNKFCFKHHGRQMIKEGIYAAGLASGVTTMVACAMGSANEAACAILSDIKGVVSVYHDTPTTRN